MEALIQEATQTTVHGRIEALASKKYVIKEGAVGLRIDRMRNSKARYINLLQTQTKNLTQEEALKHLDNIEKTLKVSDCGC